MPPASKRSQRLTAASSLRWIKAHATLIVLGLLSIVAASVHFLQGSVLTPEPPALPGVAGTVIGGSGSSLRTCTSTGTIFEGVNNFSTVEKMYLERMSRVFAERENALKKSSAWGCLGGSHGSPMPALLSLAHEMPVGHTTARIPLPRTS